MLQSAVGSAGADRYVEDIPNEDANTAQEEAERESGTSEERRLAFIITIGIGCMIVAFLAVMFIAYCIYKGSGCCKLLFCSFASSKFVFCCRCSGAGSCAIRTT